MLRFPCISMAALALLAATAGSARAERSPYYLGVSGAVSQDSNLFRLADGEALSSRASSRSDTVFGTALMAGIDQPIRRQRVNASMALRDNRFLNNRYLNNTGYNLNARLDWATVERLTGDLSLAANRSLSAFTGDSLSDAKQIETERLLSLNARLGTVTRLTFEAGLTHRTVDYAVDDGSRLDSRLTATALGLRYELGGATRLSTRWRPSRVTYPSANDGYDRHDLDAELNWTPNGLSRVQGRLSSTRTRYDRNTASDFSGLTWELLASTQATGKVRATAVLSRDVGASQSEFTGNDVFGDTRTFSDRFDTTTTRLRLGADYAFSAKVGFNASVVQARRDLSRTFGSGTTRSGNDTTTTWRLGARWSPTRNSQVGCDLSRDQRRASGAASLPYGNTGVACHGQLQVQ